MKRFVFIGSAIVVIGIAAFLIWPRGKDLTEAPPPVVFRGPPPTTVVTDPTEVFQRAFWKRPSATDKILHAERREWSVGGGVEKWQWFIVVEPSPELVKHLREENAFGLVSAETMGTVENPPAWFAPSASDFFSAPSGNMRLAFSKTKPLLYAMDAGGGFAAGAPEPVREIPPAVPSGRLPTTPPPR